MELVAFCVLWINAVPHTGSISQYYSPCTILTGTLLDWTKHCQENFGDYCETHDNPVPPNDTDILRTTPGICLGPTGNFQGTYKWFNLNTGRVIKHKSWTPYPMTSHIMERVEKLAEQDRIPWHIEFRDRHGNVTKDAFSDSETTEYSDDPNDFRYVGVSDNDTLQQQIQQQFEHDEHGASPGVTQPGITHYQP